MLKSKRIQAFLGIAAGLLVATGPARAEDTRHKWQFGFGVSFFATEDDIRSDADLQGCEGVGATLTCTAVDPRLDKNLLNENSIQDDFRFDFNVSYGFTRWFALEAGVSYFQGEIGPLESYHSFQDYNPFTGIFGPVKEFNNFTPAGEITEIPLHLSALIRFRPHAPFDPYFGFGIGYVFTDLKSSTAFDSLEAQINQLQLTDKNAPFGVDGIVAFDAAPGLPEGVQQELGLPTAASWTNALVADPLVITVNDGSSYHIRGGADYYFNEHFSIYIDGTYSWAEPAVEIRVLGQELGAITVQKAFLDSGARGLGADGFPGPYVFANQLSSAEWTARENAGLCGDSSQGQRVCQSEFLDVCRDLFFSGVNPDNANLQISDCWGEDANNNFRFDPGEDLDADGFLERTFGACIENCQCDIREDPNCSPVWVDDPFAANPVEVYEIDRITQDYVHRAGGMIFHVTPADDPVASNTFIIQGGDIDLEGFSLGVGIKFTF